MSPMNCENELMEVFSDLSFIEPDPPPVRSVCLRCRRPMITCWCKYLPAERLLVRTRVYILQHPFEETRSLRTAIMLTLGLPEGQCLTFKGKRFPQKRYAELYEIAEMSSSILLYPGEKAIDIEVLAQGINCNNRSDCCSDATISVKESYNLFVLDGTWLQAKSIFNQNTFLHTMKQVQLTNTGVSKYVVRTQPTYAALSTVETVALAIEILEQNPNIYQSLIRPLEALCDYQLQHGAVKHHSKQYLKDNGLYVKQINPKAPPRKKKKRRHRVKKQDSDVTTVAGAIDEVNGVISGGR